MQFSLATFQKQFLGAAARAFEKSRRAFGTPRRAHAQHCRARKTRPPLSDSSPSPPDRTAIVSSRETAGLFDAASASTGCLIRAFARFP
jgi:hypothetical protein